MKFRVYAPYYNDYHDLHEYYPELMKYGHEFEIEKFDSRGVAVGKNYIYLYSLEEVMTLINELAASINAQANDNKRPYFNGVIIDKNDEGELSIMIYDDYIE